MQKLIDVYPLVEVEKIFDRTYRKIKPVRFDEETAPILKKMFDFSRMLDTFFCEYLPLKVVFKEIPALNPLLVEADIVERSILLMCDKFEDLMKDINTSSIEYPTSFHRDLDKVQAILFRLKNIRK